MHDLSSGVDPESPERGVGGGAGGRGGVCGGWCQG